MPLQIAGRLGSGLVDQLRGSHHCHHHHQHHQQRDCHHQHHRGVARRGTEGWEGDLLTYSGRPSGRSWPWCICILCFDVFTGWVCRRKGNRKGAEGCVIFYFFFSAAVVVRLRRQDLIESAQPMHLAHSQSGPACPAAPVGPVSAVLFYRCQCLVGVYVIVSPIIDPCRCDCYWHCSNILIQRKTHSAVSAINGVG